MGPHRNTFQLLQLVANKKNGRPDRETVQRLRDLLKSAEAGDTIGLAYVAMQKNTRYSMDVVGQAKKAPTFTRGMLRCLDDQIADLIVKK